MRLLTKIMEEDKADFVFLPCSTAFLFAAAKLVNDHKYIAMSAEGGATTLEPKMKDLPWFFQFLNYSNHYQMPVDGRHLEGTGCHDRLHHLPRRPPRHRVQRPGRRSSSPQPGVKILSSTAVPAGAKDVSSIIKKIQGENPDAGLLVPVPAGERPDLRDHGAAELQPQSRPRRSRHVHPGVLRQLQGRPRRDHVRRRVELQAERRGQRLLREALRVREGQGERRLLGRLSSTAPSSSSSSRPSRRRPPSTRRRSPRSCGPLTSRPR